MVRLIDINQDNLFKVTALSDTLSDIQKKCVAPNIVSIAQAYVNPGKAWPKAIYDDEELIGFVMLALYDEDIKEEDQPSYFLWRFMIAKPYQSKGYGKKVLDILYKKCVEDGVKYLYTSCEMIDKMPYQFYINYGFVDTHEMDEGEEILKLTIKDFNSIQ